MKMVIVLILVLALFSAAIPASAGESRIKGSVTEVEKYGHAVLDLTEEDFTGAGFELGDIVTVTAGRFTGEVPCLNGLFDFRRLIHQILSDGIGVERGSLRDGVLIVVNSESGQCLNHHPSRVVGIFHGETAV